MKSIREDIQDGDTQYIVSVVGVHRLLDRYYGPSLIRALECYNKLAEGKLARQFEVNGRVTMEARADRW